jgi:RNA polymerase sigma factor for flagellar operon FliA
MEDARTAQIRDLLPVVRQLARRVQRMLPHADLDDLIGDGCIGAIRAVDAFDPDVGIPLEQYARKVMLGSMLNGVRRLDPVSERVRRTVRAGERARYALAHDIGALPDAALLEQRVPGYARARIEAHRGTPLSLDAAFPPGERLSPDRNGDPQAVVVADAERARMRCAIAELPPRQRTIVVAHYFEGRSLRSLQPPFGVSPQRISQLHLAAVARLRAALGPPG